MINFNLIDFKNNYTLNCFFIIFIVLSSHLYAQNHNLCGIWIGHNYPCDTVDANGLAHFYYKNEIIEISQNGTNVVATKIVGDHCVTDGNITWQGTYVSDTFNVIYTLGSYLYPNSSSNIGQIFVINDNRIETPYGFYFTRADCNQIDSMEINSTQISIDCLNCELFQKLKMPNVFTPNFDKINDVFKPVNYKTIKQPVLQIFNRWGHLIYKTKELYLGWDGKYENEILEPGVYFWVINYLDKNDKSVHLSGFVTLLN